MKLTVTVSFVSTTLPLTETGTNVSFLLTFNPYPANVDNMATSFLPTLANGGWDLIRRLKG